MHHEYNDAQRHSIELHAEVQKLEEKKIFIIHSHYKKLCNVAVLFFS